MRNVCTQAKSILTSFILQVIDQPVSNRGPLGVGSASQSPALQSDLPLLCSSGKQPLFRTGSFPASLLQRGVFSAERRPLGPKPPMPCKITKPREELRPEKREAGKFRLCLAEDQFET